jgi:GWxTD domain-containing protein
MLMVSVNKVATNSKALRRDVMSVLGIPAVDEDMERSALIKNTQKKIVIYLISIVKFHAIFKQNLLFDFPSDFIIFSTMIPLLTIAWAAFEVWGAAQLRAHADKKLMAQQLFQEALSARHALALEDYIDRLQHVTKLDGKFAEAFHELGRAYIECGTIAGRNQASAALERAIQLAPRNIEYRYTMAQLQLKREARAAAAGEFRQMMKLDPTDPRPYYHLALFKEEDMLHYRDMVSLHEDAVIYFYSFAEKDFAEAERLLRSAIGLAPRMAEAYHHLAGLYFDAQRYHKMADLLNRAVKHVASADVFLFLGLARHQLGQTDSAMQAYQHALQLMPPQDRAFFYSLQPVLSPDSLKVYEKAPDSVKTQIQQRFWKARDPLFLTEANERLLEHFGRIAYANLRYSVPGKNIVGWKTDRGKTLIRFGNPRTQVRTRADLGTTPTGHIKLNPSQETWNYGDFYINFSDAFMNGNYTFAWGDFETDGKWVFEHKIRKEPERYVFPHGGWRLELPHIIAQFRSPEDSTNANSNHTLVEIYFGLADSSLREVRSTAEGYRQFALHRGLFFFDANWNEIRQWQENRTLSFSAAQNAPAPNYLIDRWPVQMPPGAYHLSLEVLDQRSGHSGAERKMIVIEDFSGEQLQMSSVVLASAATKTSDEENFKLALYQKDDVYFVPSLFHKFSADTPIDVYYEVYNLTLDVNGQSRYRIDYVVETLQENKSLVSRAFDRLGQLLRRGERQVAITSSFESTGNQRREKLCHSIAMLGHPAGQHHLTIRLTDEISGQSAERRVAFEIIKYAR